MSDRRCPYCDERVPSYSLTCPRCYKDIPRDEEDTKSVKDATTSDSVSRFVTDRTAVLLLALIPSAFGLMGLGQIYERRYKKGLMFLAVGLLLFLTLVLLVDSLGRLHGGWPFLVTGAAILIGLMFLGVYLFQAFDALVGSFFTAEA
ncbi:MAG: hypothetical protein WC067_03320 [Candidatus Methanomethylophilaceae archaeon]